jgi:hypothetical protein
MKRNKIYFLYFLYDGIEVVYIGITTDLKTRMKSHKNKIHNSVIIERYASKADALRNERKYTIMFQPKYSWIPPHLLTHPHLGSQRKFGKLVVAIKEKQNA